MNSLLLSGIISSIPDQAFKSRKHRRAYDHDHDNNDISSASPKQIKRYRAFLANEVAEIQDLLNSEHSNERFRSIETVRMLKELIEQIRKITIDNYAVVDATQFTQPQVVSGIHAIIDKIN